MKFENARIFEENTCMKTKLTLTVQKNVIDAVRKRARKSGKSISGLFEEVFEEKKQKGIQSESQRAAARLLRSLEQRSGTPTLEDKALLRKHIENKYA
jgi:hypothetical protein